MSNLDPFFQFKISDTVRPKVQRAGYTAAGSLYTPQIMVVVERALTECYGGVQAIYRCRVHTAGEGGVLSMNAGGNYGFVTELIRLTEPELVAYEPPPLTAEKPARRARAEPPDSLKENDNAAL